MTENLLDFTEALASTAPTPGGGGAAALEGALGASLGAMAAGLSAGRKGDEARRLELEELGKTCGELRLRFLAQIDADACVFLPLSRAYRLPKDTPGREETLRRASLEACAAALEMLRLCARTAGLLTRLYEKASPLLLSDVGCAASACRASLISAAMNVFVNTKPYPEDPEAQSIALLADGLLQESLPKLEEIELQVLMRLRNEEK